jgi:uncharacterized protein YcaQ
MDSLSAAQARRIALAAQGFAEPRPRGAIDRRHFRRALQRMAIVQIDSVNVLTRSHELPFLARLGPYPRDALARWLWESGEVFEYVAHEASLLPVALHPLLRWRMEEPHRWNVDRHEDAEELERLYREVAARGRVSAAQLGAGNRPGESWWAWSTGKALLELLMHRGRITATRGPQFERVYRLPDPALAAQPAPPAREAQRALLELSARAHGVGTAGDLADYFRLPKRVAQALLREMAADGQLREVRVDGWRDAAYLHPQARLPRRLSARALLSPFDPVVWERARTERLFGFRYRIEIYTPAPKRVYGYYVLPFLLGDGLVARVDLKADRQAGALLLRAAHAEPGVDRAQVAEALADELALMAGWLGLDPPGREVTWSPAART